MKMFRGARAFAAQHENIVRLKFELVIAVHRGGREKHKPFRRGRAAHLRKGPPRGMPREPGPFDIIKAGPAQAFVTKGKSTRLDDLDRNTEASPEA